MIYFIFVFNRKWKATESKCTEQTHLLADEAQSMYTEIRPTKEEKNKLPSLLMAMLKTYWPELLFAQFLKLIYDLLQFVNPVILRLVAIQFILFFSYCFYFSRFSKVEKQPYI